MTMSTKNCQRPFLDYYQQADIIPVHQDLADLEKHRLRRAYLYQTLGLIPHFIKGRQIIEFGPGTGDNAVATHYFQPARYVFVDANPASLQVIHEKIKNNLLDAARCEIIQHDFIHYHDTTHYDIVFAEGCIPGQINPHDISQHLASFCVPGGLFITTASAPISMLSEYCRRLLKPAILQKTTDFNEQIAIATHFFEKDLLSLNTSIRNIRDWVLDTILHPWLNSALFSIPEAIVALQNDFQFYGSSPAFLTDWRWYKSIHSDSETLNALALQAYTETSLALLDYRYPVQDCFHTQTEKHLSCVETINALCQQASTLQAAILKNNNYDTLPEFLTILNDLATLLPESMSLTRASIQDFIRGMPAIAAGNLHYSFTAFSNWWGRGQQYVSFIRNG